jgi:hypothetical protein
MSRTTDLNRAVARYKTRRTDEMVQPEVLRQILIELLTRTGAVRKVAPTRGRPLGRAIWYMLRREQLPEPLPEVGYPPHLRDELPRKDGGKRVDAERLIEQLSATAEELRG